MPALKIGYARVSTDAQDLTAQRDALQALGVESDRIYVDHGFTGTTRERPGLRQALAARRAGDELVVTKLDRLARSLPDARAIADELTRRHVKLNLGGSVHDPTVTYASPVVAVALGVVLLREQPGPLAPLGLALILAGSWLASRAGSGAHVEPAPPRRSRTGQAQRAAAS